jgi:hypothetical protein
MSPFSWLHNLDDKVTKITMVEVVALCWAIWRYWHDIIFKKIKYSSFILALFRGIY